MKLLPTTTLALVVLVLASSYFQATMAGGSPAYCNPKCKARCSLAGYQERCLKYCGICCMHCNCVPSGTYGNKDECPCYRDLLNSKKKSKCP